MQKSAVGAHTNPKIYIYSLHDKDQTQSAANPFIHKGLLQDDAAGGEAWYVAFTQSNDQSARSG
jgi:hypothetical protein